MARKEPSQPTPEERRAGKIAAWRERRRRQGRATSDGPRAYDLSACPPVGPRSVITNARRASGPPDDVEVNHRGQ